MPQDIIYLMLQFGPAAIWVFLCIFGIFYGLLEMRESKEDLDSLNNESEDIRYIVAKSNYTNAFRNITIQILFLSIAFISVWMRLHHPADYPVTLFRSIIIPFILISGESLLVLQLRGLSIMRKSVRRKVVEGKKWVNDHISLEEKF